MADEVVGVVAGRVTEKGRLTSYDVVPVPAPFNKRNSR